MARGMGEGGNKEFENKKECVWYTILGFRYYMMGHERAVNN